MTTPLLPITGIGSVPHKDIQAAISFSLKFHIPFLPQMTSLGEFMIEQAKTGNYLALKDFSEIINKKKTPLFKIQIADPLTSNVSSEIIYNHIQNIIDKFKIKPLVFIDTPIIQDSTSELSKLIAKLKSLNIKVGIHSCAQSELKSFFNLPIDYLSIDGKYLENEIKDMELECFFKISSMLILGILPTDEPYNEDEIYLRYLKFIKKYKQHIILSPACGLSNMSEDKAQSYLESLLNLRQRFIDQA